VTATARRPTVGSTAVGILESWLPNAFRAADNKYQVTSPRLRLSLSGPEGGEWDMQVCDGALSVDRCQPTIGVRREDPDIWIRQPAADFLAVIFPSDELLELLPPSIDVVDLLCAESQEMELLQRLEGRIKFELEGKRRRRWYVDVAFGRSGMMAGRPRTTVTVDAATCEKLATRAVNPLQALLAGRLRVDGDKALAMQVLMLVATRTGG
jgi:hypothetical protein